jgi:hypothetical protein
VDRACADDEVLARGEPGGDTVEREEADLEVRLPTGPSR